MTAVLWLLAIALFLALAWSLNLTMFNWWASSGPPVEHPEIYKTRGNVFFAIACALLLCFSLAVVTLVRRRRARRTNNLHKVGYVGREEIAERIREQYAPEYAELLLVQMGYVPRICPKCHDQSFTTLWLADPRNPIEGKLWAKWYFWCNQGLCGIYCPLGTWRIPRETPHILYGDEKAISAALPEGLQLIQPTRPRLSADGIARAT